MFIRNSVILLLAAALVVGCGGGGGGGGAGSGASNVPPTISGVPASTVAVGFAYSFTPAASDPENDALTFSIQNKPAWLSFSTSTGQLSGTPSVADVASYPNITISVTDGTTTVALASFTVTVSNPPPTIAGVPGNNAAVGFAYSFTPTASDLNGDTLTFSIRNRPPWMAFSPSTGQLSGTPAAGDVGSYADIMISVSDGTTVVALAPFTLAVGTTSLTAFAGNVYGAGNADGTGLAASFRFPEGIASDGAGTVYVADTQNHVIRKVTPAGVVSTLAGVAGVFGSVDGAGAAARFYFPQGIATDAAGNVYVADTGNHTIRKVTPGGVVSTLAGTAGAPGSEDGSGAAARFSGPRAIATDSAGNVYVADTENDTIRKVSPAGVVSTLAGTAGVPGSADGAGTAALFSGPLGIATDSAGNVYVADFENDTIRKITPAGVVSTLAGAAGVSGTADGTGNAARFKTPFGIAVDGAGNLYVSDSVSDTIRKITPTRVVSTLAGSPGVTGSADGAGATARFYYPQGIATDGAGNVYVADSGNNIIRKVTPTGVTSTLAGAAGASGSADGTGIAARFSYPLGIATDGAGNVYVADLRNDTIRMITPASVVSTLAGSAGASGSADGTGATARFSLPQGIAADGAGNVYVADTGNNIIRKITAAGAVSTLAGAAGIPGSADGTGAAARFVYPLGIATDGTGNVYVSDTESNTIRKIVADGMGGVIVSTLAGSAGASGSADGTGAAARFSLPQGIATDSAGNVYVADSGNNTIRMITPAGVVSTLAGDAGASGSADGTGAAARFSYPLGIAADSAGNLYVADTDNDTIRRITPAGVVTTLVGTPGVIGFAAGALPGVLASPAGVAVNGTSLYIITNNGVAVVENLP